MYVCMYVVLAKKVLPNNAYMMGRGIHLIPEVHIGGIVIITTIEVL